MTASGCWTPGTGWRPGGSDRWRPRWNGATSCSMRPGGGCPGPFTLEGAEAVAGAAAGPAVLHLVDCSLLVPPQAGPDGRWRYVMLETLRAYGARLLGQAGEQEQAKAALAGYALEVAGQAAAGLQTGTGEQAAARWLDTENATTRQALAWAMQHDAAR